MPQAIKSVVLFIVRRPKDTAIILMALILALLSWRLYHQKAETQELSAKIEGLPPDTKQTVTVYRDRVVTKWRAGSTKIEYRDKYLPPEGHVEIVTKENEPEKSPEIKIKDWGLTSRLGGGIIYSGNLLPLVDFKWFYWKRCSLNVGVTSEFGGVGVSRHIDDFLSLTNLEAIGIVGQDWYGRVRFGVGIRLNF